METVSKITRIKLVQTNILPQLAIHSRTSYKQDIIILSKIRNIDCKNNGSLQFGNFEAKSKAVAFAGQTIYRSFSGGAALFPVSFHSIGQVGRVRSSRSGFDLSQRARVVGMLESESQTTTQEIDSCPADMVDHMPCEDPRINGQLSREMNYYRERHFSKRDIRVEVI
ncbi:Methyltransferase [Forsythia ovata]|uniref:Methyltransferase n=1 Tax=Forsythia ovata TaxID=205694 RepID=A0ABD1S9G4_9LAMI